MSLVQLEENRPQGTTRIPILTYHSIDKSGSVISTAPDEFRRQMEFLSAAGYQTVTLSELISAFSEKRGISPDTVVLTFDDGFQNFYTTAFPILEESGFVATVFLVTDRCGKFNDWSGNPPELPRSEMLSWEHVEELSRHGIEFGGHTRTHPDLTKLSEEDAIAEVAESKKALEDMLGREATTFAYPYGKHNGQVRQIVKNTFAAACSTNLGKVTSNSDFFSLERIDTYYLSNPKIFGALSQRSFDRYLKVRQAMRSFKSLINRN
jgi:peptidoglycan/xylan/chitin deacetylase (PgdA/CDA1 family)